MRPYEGQYPLGSAVAVVPLTDLEEFRLNWRLHHPLAEAQLLYADHRAHIKSVFFYHGGDVLYVLDDVPSMWHERCLRGAS